MCNIYDSNWILDKQFEYRHFIPGYSKEAQKEVYKYQILQRYEQSPETEAIVNAKFQYVLCILGFILVASLVWKIFSGPFLAIMECWSIN